MNRLARLLLPPGGATPARVYAWTLVSGALYAGESFLVLVAATRLAGPFWGGVAGLAFAVDQLLFTVGAFSVRRYQASDAAERFPFPVYCGTRALTCGAMVLAGLAWAAFGDFSADKRAAILPLLVFKASEAFSDVLGGRYQQLGRLDAAGRILAAKTLLSAAAFAAALALGAPPPAAFWTMAVAHLALTALLDGAVLPSFGGLRLRLPRRPAAALLLGCSPLAATAFLQMFVNNVPKFAVDAATDERTMAAFSALAMASFVLVVLADLVSAPHVARLGRAREAGRWRAFPRAALALSAAMAVAGAAACAGAWLFGIPVLSALFGLDLSPYRPGLCVLVLSGTLLALHLVADVVLVVLRRQSWCLLSAVLGAAVAAATARPFVEARGVLGAALCHLASAGVLALSNAAVAAFFLRRASVARTDRGVVDCAP